jgi:parallel beta-helix repeat protein
MKSSKLRGLAIIILFTSMLSFHSINFYDNRAFWQMAHFNPQYKALFSPLDAEIFIESDADLIDYDFPGNGTTNNPYRIENYIINTFKLYGILIVNTTKHVIVQNNCISASNAALKTEFNAPGTLSFYNNTCKNSDFGLYMNSTTDIIVRNNDFDRNNESILVLNTRDVLIENNTIRNNRIGIVLVTTNASTPTVNCSIIFNLLENNTGYGVSIPAFNEHRWTEENSIHHNTFANNNAKSKKQALDDGGCNNWDDEVGTGNYWSDWWGIGSYDILGLAKSKDKYPLDEPIHEVTTKIPGIFKGRILIFVVFTPVLLGGYIFVHSRKRRTKIIEEEKR